MCKSRRLTCVCTHVLIIWVSTLVVNRNLSYFHILLLYEFSIMQLNNENRKSNVD